MGDELGEVALLYSEPDILTKVFLMLDWKDLLVVEEVCREWRYFGRIEVKYSFDQENCFSYSRKYLEEEIEGGGECLEVHTPATQLAEDES